MDAYAPLGVFDSGLGGLLVLRDLRTELPGENLLFVADSGHAPYGDKPEAYIQERCLALTRFQVEERAKAIVVACNTATAAAAALIRSIVRLPVVAMEPAVKPAAAITKTGVVGELATAGMLASTRFRLLLERFGHGVTLVTQAARGLGEQIERGTLRDRRRVRWLSATQLRCSPPAPTRSCWARHTTRSCVRCSKTSWASM
jgi:glutamate racemase